MVLAHGFRIERKIKFCKVRRTLYTIRLYSAHNFKIARIYPDDHES